MTISPPTNIVKGGSRRWQDNVRAREDVFAKHKKLMRQHGVSHLYLLDSMLRVLQHPLGDRGQARQHSDCAPSGRGRSGAGPIGQLQAGCCEKR